jgi:hypothetical protein
MVREERESPSKVLLLIAAATWAVAMTASRVELQTMTLSYTYTDKWGGTHTITTIQGPEEPIDAFEARHEAAIALRKEKYPPAPG